MSADFASKPTKVVAAASTNATLVQAGQVKLWGYNLKNTAAYPVYIKFFDKATAPSPGTDVPYFTVAVLAGERADLDRWVGVQFQLGLGYTITKLIADNDTTVVVANDLVGQLFWNVLQ